MTAHELAAIHASAMRVPSPWSASTFESFLSAPGVLLATSVHGFALGRVIVDEAELLTLAVAPEARRRGEARHCLTTFEDMARRDGATRAFLEVAATNSAARALYSQAGFQRDGVRRGYYRVKGSEPIDAIVMSKSLLPA